ncbi:hypothetical protein [Staphylococcus haemolyticus]
MSKFILQFEVLDYSSFFYYIWSKYGHFILNNLFALQPEHTFV